MTLNSPTAAGLIVLTPIDDAARSPETVALTGVEVDAKVQGPTTRVRVRQRYENRESVPIEATYVFPLPEGAAVCGFDVTIEGHPLRGVVKERDQAFDDYDDAMAEGRGAFLLDQERPNVFTASVGNLLPGQVAEVELRWVSELEREGNGFRLAIPSSVSPRYAPESRRDAEGMDDVERVHPPVTTGPLPYGLKLTVDVDLLTPLKIVESPSHKVRVELDGPRARVELAGDEGRLDRDVVLRFVPSDPARPVAGHVVDEHGDRTAVVTLTPNIEFERPPLDVTFLLDCSGSMGGSSIAEARETLRVCLRSLHPGDRFDIVRFGSHFERCFKKLRSYDDESLKKADQWLQKVDADMGGTEILTPLKVVLSEPVEDGRARRLVMLTDGEVMNEDEVLHLVGQHRASTRVFTFGIGYGASEFLVRGAARASGGASEMIAPGEKIEDKVMRQFRRIAQPKVEDLRLEWEGLETAEIVPRELDAVFSGEPLTVYARVLGDGRGTARLSGRVDDASWQTEIEVEPLEDASAVIPILWARGRIRELEEGDVWTGLRGSQQHRRKRNKAEREREDVKQQLVELGTRYGLLSAATSYVVIDDRADAPRAEMPAQLRETPTALTRGWGGIDLGCADATLGMDHTATVARMFSPKHLTRFARSSRSAPGDRAEHADMGDFGEEGPSMANVILGAASPDPDREILLAQHAEGSWKLGRELTDWVGVDLELVQRLVEQLGGGPDLQRIVATLLVIRAVEARPEGVSDRWAGPLEKARAWSKDAARRVAAPSGHESWEEWVAQLQE